MERTAGGDCEFYLTAMLFSVYMHDLQTSNIRSLSLLVSNSCVSFVFLFSSASSVPSFLLFYFFALEL
jgi:hypothetical protein